MISKSKGYEGDILMNEKEVYMVKVKFLTKIGIAVYVIACVVLRIWSMINPSEVLRPFHIVAFTVFEIIYLPFVRLIHFYGKKAESKNTMIITNIITGLLLILLIFVIIICAKGMVVID